MKKKSSLFLDRVWKYGNSGQDAICNQGRSYSYGICRLNNSPIWHNLTQFDLTNEMKTRMQIVLGLTHTLLQRTLYSKGTLCIVTSCSKEQFASNWHVTVCSLTHFTPQHTLPPGMFFSSAQFASQHPLLPKTPCSSTHFASQHTLLLRTLCSSAHFASKNTLLLGTLYSSTHFAS